MSCCATIFFGGVGVLCGLSTTSFLSRSRSTRAFTSRNYPRIHNLEIGKQLWKYEGNSSKVGPCSSGKLLTCSEFQNWFFIG